MKGLRNPFACLRSSPGSVGAGISYSTDCWENSSFAAGSSTTGF